MNKICITGHVPHLWKVKQISQLRSPPCNFFKGGANYFICLSQRVAFNKLWKGGGVKYGIVCCNLTNYKFLSGHKWSTTHRVLKCHRSKMSVIYVIMKTMCPPGYHHSGFVATPALRLHRLHPFIWPRVTKCMSCHKAIVVITGKAYCFHDNIDR